MDVYLAGPMSGCKNYNFPAFHEAQRALEKLGHIVVNPAMKETLDGTDLPDPNKIPKQWGGNRTDLDAGIIRCRDFQELLVCKVVMLLYGWQDSWGARLEAAVAIACGMKLYEIKLTSIGCEYREVESTLTIATHLEFKDEGHTDTGNVGLTDV